MRIVLQRVKRACVSVNANITGSIDNGILILLGIHNSDTPKQADYLAEKCSALRIFPDENEKMNRSLTDIGGRALVVSQFTLYGDCSHGPRPSFTEAAGAEKGQELYLYFVEKLEALVGKVETGVFGAMMNVELVNDGPVTLILDA
jgi:D-tyrosyl-tRNA(Tyr) deacylase